MSDCTEFLAGLLVYVFVTLAVSIFMRMRINKPDPYFVDRVEIFTGQFFSAILVSLDRVLRLRSHHPEKNIVCFPNESVSSIIVTTSVLFRTAFGRFIHF